MPPKLRKVFALWYMRLSGLTTPKDLSEEVVDWAISELVDGNITDSMSILASLTLPVHWQELEFYLQRVLDESRLTAPPEEECLRLYARDIAQEIVTGAVPPLQGCSRIYQIALFLEYPDDMMNWVYLDDALEPGTYQELAEEALHQAILQQAIRFCDTT